MGAYVSEAAAQHLIRIRKTKKIPRERIANFLGLPLEEYRQKELDEEFLVSEYDDLMEYLDSQESYIMLTLGMARVWQRRITEISFKALKEATGIKITSREMSRVLSLHASISAKDYELIVRTLDVLPKKFATNEEFDHRVSRQAKMHGISMKDIAELSKVSLTTLQNMVDDKFKVLAVEKMDAVIDALKTLKEKKKLQG